MAKTAAVNETTFSTRRFYESLDDGDAAEYVIVEVEERDEPEHWMDPQPAITMGWGSGEISNGRPAVFEEIRGLTLVEAKAMQRCLKAAIRHIEDLEDAAAE